MIHMPQWARMREAATVTANPALVRSGSDDMDMDDDQVPSAGDVDTPTPCPTCSGEGVTSKGDICSTCMGTGYPMREAKANPFGDKKAPPFGSKDEDEDDKKDDPKNKKTKESGLCTVCLCEDCDIPDVMRMAEAVLTAKARKAIPKGKFAVPEKAPASGSYPIHDRAHAIAALSYSSGKPEEGKVKAAVYKAYPDLKKSKESASLEERLAALEQSAARDAGILKSIREARPASMTPTFSTPARVKTSDGQEGYAVWLIREGKGNAEDDQWYTIDAIKEMCEAGVCEGMQAFGNHPDLEEEELRPERDVKELVGTYHDVKFSESGKPHADAVLVPLTLDEHHPRYGWVVTLAEAAVRSTAQQPICGISLYGLSAGDDGERPDGSFGRIVSMIRPTSGDIVTSAGAGGGFIRQLMESARALHRRSLREEQNPMKLMAYQSAMREAAKRVREATSDDDRNEALTALAALENETIDNVPDTIESLREAAPALVEQIRESVTAEVKEADEDVKKENEQLRSQLREAQTTLGGINDAVGVTEALRAADVTDPVEFRHYAGMAQQRGLREAADIKQMVETEREFETNRQAAMIEKMRESFDFDLDAEIEGAGGRTPVSVLPTDGGLAAMREAGLPVLDAS